MLMISHIPFVARRGFVLFAAWALASPAAANNVGENGAWQFRTSTDLANLATVLEVIQKKQSGAYASPTYTTNTTIEHQYNCSVSATATGNSGNETALANSPSVTGASASSIGNTSTTGFTGEVGATSSTSQVNSGLVSSGVVGGTSATVLGTATQALNSSQTNSGTQLASATGSTGCAFGALN